MIPGVGKAIKDLDIDNNAFKGVEAIIQSMTPYERQHPECMNQSRKNRIAKGSGTTIQEVNRLVKQFDDMRKVMKKMNDFKANPRAMMQMQQMAAKMKGKGFPGM